MGLSIEKHENRRLFYIDLLRFIACALITNSHFDGVYPIDISFGGCPGNCLFFIITGFLLNGKSGEKDKFISWYFPKIVRLYISLFIVNVVLVSIGYKKASLELFFFPINDNSWFIPCIMILYVAIYLFIKNKVLAYFLLLTDICVYIYEYVFVFEHNDFFVEKIFDFRLFYGLVAAFIGTLLRQYIDKINSIQSKKGIMFIVISLLSMMGFLVTKVLISSGSAIALHLQFLTQLLSMIFAASLFVGIASFDIKLENIMKDTIAGKVVSIVGLSTLEIYLVQFVIISKIKSLIFPLNFVLIIISVIFVALILHIVCDGIYKKMIGLWSRE